MRNRKICVCKYCGKEYNAWHKNRVNCCGTCSGKVTLLPEFIKARDDLREKLGLERMGARPHD